jgi:hypothetical protein
VPISVPHVCAGTARFVTEFCHTVLVAQRSSFPWKTMIEASFDLLCYDFQRRIRIEKDSNSRRIGGLREFCPFEANMRIRSRTQGESVFLGR